MFKINLKIALRNIWRHKLTTSIKLTGLVVGLTTVMLLLSYVMFELSFDQHNENVNEIYRLQSLNWKDGKTDINLPSGLANMLVEEFPEVSRVTMMDITEMKIKVGNVFFKKGLLQAETAFFEMFTAPLLVGNPKTVLEEPKTLVISESFAKAAFPKGNAVGQQIYLVNYNDVYRIVGVMKDLPKTSHFKADLITKGGIQKLNWSAYGPNPQYIQLKKGVSPAVFQQKIKTVYTKYNFPENIKITLMPLSKIHLHSHTANELDANTDIKYIYIFSTIAFFILLIAIVNFINLTIAASIKRAKEIGVKKVMGASPKQLMLQFLSESYLYFIVAALLVSILTYDLLPVLGAKLGIDISFSSLLNFKTILISLSIIVVAGFTAGLYPAMVLSKLAPVKTLKGYTGYTSGNFGLKKVLMVFQFAVSGFLIVCTLGIYAQLNFIRSKNLGFDREQVLISSFNRYGENYARFKDELELEPSVKSISLSGINLGTGYGGGVSWKNENDTTTYKADLLGVDFDFFKTLNVKVIKGRGFSPKFGADLINYDVAEATLSDDEYHAFSAQRSMLLNESAVKLLKLNNPIDTILNRGFVGKVIGVVSDFNGKSLHQEVGPLAIFLSVYRNTGHLYVKMNPGDLVATKAKVEQLWKKHFPNIPPDLRFLDEHLEQLYQSEMRLGSLFLTFAGIAIFLCCTGLFGMVFFELDQRTKEVAIRKVLGASVQELLSLLNASFIKVVFVANLLIWPLAYYLIKQWLNGFHYRIELSIWPFAIALIISLVLTLITVSAQAWKTIQKSPVKALKYE